MKKTALVLFAMMITAFGLKAEVTPTFFAEGSQLFVVANSGLNMRETPDATSMTINTIPYGSLVTVMPFDQECVIIQEIEWTRGSWIKVEYDGYEGYVFDGFLSPLAVPRYAAEVTEGYNSIFNMVDNWVNIHLLPVANPDTITNEYSQTIRHNFEGGEKYEKQLYGAGYRTKVYFSGTRMMDVFHLVKGFFNSNGLKEAIDDQTLFIKDNNGNLKLIKIYNNNYTEIKSMDNGQIRLTINEPKDEVGC